MNSNYQHDDEALKRFIYQNNGWPLPQVPSKPKNPNIRGESMGTLWLDGKVFAKGSFPLLKQKEKAYCKMYGISKERAKIRFKTTY